MIDASLYVDFFIRIPSSVFEKILPSHTSEFRGDHRIALRKGALLLGQYWTQFFTGEPSDSGGQKEKRLSEFSLSL